MPLVGRALGRMIATARAATTLDASAHSFPFVIHFQEKLHGH
jgi:hypothetical protein